MTKTNKCAHPACNCIAPEGKKYCSDVCADAKGTLEIRCQCRHPACQES